ncbi:hypothetical protein QSV08_18635 [Maribacter sp. BPC-D8]|uniref:hypothetical protein n=1 Tax=Maribacter sp. BPC-D8 TaxID=3053613 RepID=UPI002B47B2B0|nr:hypothetical protein [Maribacter sp. BPC-D8]WRI29226.1 hypothetical protein QSV08_18635 [Maribacter sp. BPC-D8]
MQQKYTMDYLDDLFERLENNDLRPGLTLPEGVSYQTNLTVSWNARIESKKLSDPKWISPLKERLNKEKITIEKINIIRVLIPLADKNKENSIADYIITFIKQEKTRWVRDVALSSLNNSELEIINEKEYLFELIKDKDWQIKLSALGLWKKLDKSYSNRIEDVCLDLIEKNQKKPHELSSICGVLAKHGTTKSLPQIKEIAKNNSKAFTVNSAINAVREINGAKELDFFIEIFQTNRNNDVKSMITQVLCEFGGESVIDLLIKRAKNILSKKRKTNMIYVGGSKPELVHILTFLTTYDDKKVNKLIDFIRTKKIELMDETELTWFKEKVKTT